MTTTAAPPVPNSRIAGRARSLISLDDLTDADLFGIVRRGADLAAAFGTDLGTDSATGASPPRRPMIGQVAGMYFAAPSTRTRTAFSSGALRLGAGLVTFGPHDLQVTTGETVEDTGRVLAGMLDVLVARTAGDPDVLRQWAGHQRMAVINAMTADEHPTQALADLSTLLQHFGRLDGLRVLYVGEGNNTAAALTLALSRCPGTVLELRTPEGYGLAPTVLARAQCRLDGSAAQIHERHDMDDLPSGIDVIYTTQWQTTGSCKIDPNWRRTFEPFQVGTHLWRANPRAIFMHDLPAHRGDEVTAEVLDGPASIAFQQAQNKMHSAMAVLEWARGCPLPTDSVPTDSVPTDRVPTDRVPTDRVPTDRVPTDRVPTDRVPTDGHSTDSEDSRL